MEKDMELEFALDFECCHDSTLRTSEEKTDLIHRLNRIEGQIRGIKRMLEDDAYCPEIMVQVGAANAALNAFNRLILSNHIRTCVAEDLKEGNEESVDELIRALRKILK